MVHAKASALLALACLGAVACKPDAAKKSQSDIRISGPVGTEYSVHPVFEGAGRNRILGCCSFAVGKAKVRKLEGDLDGREVVGMGFHATLSFGPDAISSRFVRGGRKFRIDGVEVSKDVVENPGPQEPTFVYTALVPWNSEARAKKIVYPELEA
jgi:hypothetical protein